MDFIGKTILGLTLTLITVGALFYFLDKYRPINKGQLFYRKEFFTDIFYASFNTILVSPFVLLAWHFLPDHQQIGWMPYQLFANEISSWPIAVQVVIDLALIDFVTYWRHRITHKWVWRFHAVHHSAEEIDWLTRHRAHPGDAFISTLAALSVGHVVGFGELGIGTAIVIYTIVDYINHANLKFGFKNWLRYIFVTPQFHRWHHAVDKSAIDKNFAAMFSFYDFIFGSYYCPVNAYPTCYGLAGGAQKSFPAPIQQQLLYPFRGMLLSFKRTIAPK